MVTFLHEGDRPEELARLRTRALDEGVPLVDRARAVIERMRLVDDILSERIAEIDKDGREA
jgi:hypothetical protein